MYNHGRPHGRGEAQYKEGLTKRLELAAQFPVGTAVTWFGDDVGEVTGHTPLGRVQTSLNPTHGYEPKELTKK
jgi:hypothetical protein